MVSDRLDNVTQTISKLLEGYDIRLRPNFGGNSNNFLLMIYYENLLNLMNYINTNRILSTPFIIMFIIIYSYLI